MQPLLRAGACALVLALALAAPRARAEVSDVPNYVIGSLTAGIPYATLTAILMGEAIDDATHGHGLAEGGAIVEIVWGAAHLSVGVGLGIAIGVAYSSCRNCGDGWVPWAGVIGALTVLGGYFLSHGIWSLGDGHEPPPPLTPLIAPTANGAVVGVSGLLE